MPNPDPEKEPAVQRLNAKGRNDSEIARELDVWPSTVTRIRNRLGLPRRDEEDRAGHKAFDPAKARRLHREGLNDREIAERLDVARTTINRWRRLAGLPRNGTQGRKKTVGGFSVTNAARREAERLRRSWRRRILERDGSCRAGCIDGPYDEAFLQIAHVTSAKAFRDALGPV